MKFLLLSSVILGGHAVIFVSADDVRSIARQNDRSSGPLPIELPMAGVLEQTDFGLIDELEMKVHEGRALRRKKKSKKSKKKVKKPKKKVKKPKKRKTTSEDMTAAPSPQLGRALEEISAELGSSGAADYPANSLSNRLWLGRANHPEQPLPDKISLIVTYCDGELEWINDFADGFTFDDIFIVSKCNNDPPLESLPFYLEAKVLHLPNVGGCDHTMAYWMSEIFPSLGSSGDEVYFFLKDRDVEMTDGALLSRDFHSVLSTVSSDGFSCLLEPNEKYGFSFYHDTSVLEGFEMQNYIRTGSNLQGEIKADSDFKSPFSDLGDWHSALAIDMPQPLAPVCYGGMYAVQASRIMQVPIETFEDMATSLSRGNNIEEGHFAERTWASLFLDELDSDDAESLIASSRMVYPFHDSWTGSLMKFEVSIEEKREI